MRWDSNAIFTQLKIVNRTSVYHFVEQRCGFLLVTHPCTINPSAVKLNTIGNRSIMCNNISCPEIACVTDFKRKSLYLLDNRKYSVSNKPQFLVALIKRLKRISELLYIHCTR